VNGHAEPLQVAEPVVAVVHEAGVIEPALLPLFDPEFAAGLRRRTEAAVRAATRILTPSESTRRGLLAAWALPSDVVHVAPYGVDATVFRPERRGAVPEQPFVLFVSALHPRKNLGVLRAAMASIARRGLPHSLVIVAGPARDRPDQDALEAAAFADLEGVPGRVVRVQDPDDERLADLMAAADAFCLPSLDEGFGLTALEAMACGAAVVASDRGALPEVVDGAGILVAPIVQAVEDALARVLTDGALRSSLGSAAHRRALLFPWSRTAEQWTIALELAAAACR
jgi:glycosyltransferase involved in cell wall biosynthesis